MFLSNPTSKYSLCACVLNSDCVCVGASDLRAELACEHGKKSECQQLGWDGGPEGSRAWLPATGETSVSEINCQALEWDQGPEGLCVHCANNWS